MKYGGPEGGPEDPYLPAVGYAEPRQPRYRARWENLLNAMALAGVNPRDWPHRAEGQWGLAEQWRWHMRWELHGEGAVLEALEQLWNDEHPRRRAGRKLEPTVAEVTAELLRRREAGESTGYDALAAHFHVDSSTIRRRLGKLKKTP
jgi:hypothetical protein